KPQTVELKAISTIVRDYKLPRLTSGQLVRIVELHRRAGDRDAMLKAGTALARLKKHAEPNQAMQTLREAVQDAVRHGRAAEAIALLEQVPRESNLQPQAARTLGEYLIWWVADAQRAAAALEPFEDRDPAIKQLRGQALVLAGQGKKGREL